MTDYKELIGDIGDCLIAQPSGAVCKRLLREAADAIEQLVKERNASVDAEPVVHGRWIDDGVWDVCSVCGRAFLKVHLNGNPTFNYCPNCGAKMDEVSE